MSETKTWYKVSSDGKITPVELQAKRKYRNLLTPEGKVYSGLVFSTVEKAQAHLQYLIRQKEREKKQAKLKNTTLSPREIETMQYIQDGVKIVAIAQKYNVSRSKVNKYRKDFYNKTGLSPDDKDAIRKVIKDLGLKPRPSGRL